MKRSKQRYLALKLEREQVVNQREILNAVWAALTKLYGEYGASQARLALIDFDEKNQTAILRVSLSMLQQVRASIASITQVSGKEAALHVIGISGTIKALNKQSV